MWVCVFGLSCGLEPLCLWMSWMLPVRLLRAGIRNSWLYWNILPPYLSLAGLLRGLPPPYCPMETCWRAVCSVARANPESYCTDEYRIITFIPNNLPHWKMLIQIHTSLLFLILFLHLVVWLLQGSTDCTRIAELLLLSKHHRLPNIDATVCI